MVSIILLAPPWTLCSRAQSSDFRELRRNKGRMFRHEETQPAALDDGWPPK
jgi:hypothetical protein